MLSYTNLFIAASILAGAFAASFEELTSSAASASKDMTSKLDGWTSSDGLTGALAIQQDFPNVASAYKDLNSGLSSVSADEVDISHLQEFTSSASSLLDAITTKASDFKDVGASQIVTNDLKELSDPATGIIKSLVGSLSKDSAKWKEASGELTGLEEKYNSANSAYGLPTVQFETPSVESESSASSSEKVQSKETTTSSSSSATTAVASSTTEKPASSSHAVESSSAIVSSKHKNGTTTHTPHLDNGATSLKTTASVGIAGLTAAALFLI